MKKNISIVFLIIVLSLCACSTNNSISQHNPASTDSTEVTLSPTETASTFPTDALTSTPVLSPTESAIITLGPNPSLKEKMDYLTVIAAEAVKTSTWCDSEGKVAGVVVNYSEATEVEVREYRGKMCYSVIFGSASGKRSSVVEVLINVDDYKIVDVQPFK